ncbi:MAG: pyridoxal phosphate-dependent aminotransferase [bacterium]|jgi:aspartate/methionine/tyrosine aminotransferase
MLSDRISKVGASETLRIMAKAKELMAQGIDVINMGVGEPDFPTPENIKEAGKAAIDRNLTKYTPNPGLPELRRAIIEKLKRDNNLDYSPDEVIVSAGAKNSLFNLFMSIISPGEEVIIPAPYWVSYPQQVTLAGGRSVIVQTREEDDFKLKPEALEQAINFNTKAIIINNPSNPTGTAYTREELEALCTIAAKEGLYIVADEIYEKLVYDGFRFASIASLGKAIKEKTIIINGVSKAYSMTGWRIGFAAGPRDVIAAMNKAQGHNTSNACSVSQAAAIEAYEGPQMEIPRMVSEFQRRRNYVMQKLRMIPNVSCVEPRGAFYVFPNFSAYFDKEYKGMLIRNSHGLAYFLLKYANVAIVPGAAFGRNDCIRISYATSMENVEKAMDRITDAVSRLRTAPSIKRVTLSNVMTHVKGTVPSENEIPVKMRNALVSEIESVLRHDNYFEWNANISGVIVQLRTNMRNVYEFWTENWYPSELEGDVEPHAIVYAVDGVPGREPRAFYSFDSKTGVIINCDSYDQVRKWALALVTDIVEHVSETHTIHGACLDFDGKGLAVIAPPGLGRGTIAYGLLRYPGAKMHSNDFFVVRYSASQAVADVSERKFYVRTRVARTYGDLGVLFDKSKLENVVTRKEDCLNTSCPDIDSCDLDRGEPRCYWASKYSRALLDPYWLGGVDKYVKRTTLGAIAVLRSDRTSRTVERLGAEDAIHYLEEGRYARSGSALAAIDSQPYYNPYILVPTRDRLDLHRRYFEYLLKLVPCYLVNTGVEKKAAVIEKLADLASGM